MVASGIAAALADRYRVDREVGQGGMATVYLAQDLRHNRLVAVKVLRPELAAVIGADRFLTEITTTAKLQHPHILPLFDSGEADSYLFYVMPYVEGESLRDRLQREKQLPIVDAVRIATEVASALDYAHRHGVIHRDIKPENILLHDGQALVADFGIALAASKAGSRMTETGMSLGTPHYMSPEQAMGEREITARSDVYALGAITYEMLVGDPPFTGSTAQAIVAKVVTTDPVPPTQHRRTVPGHVEDAVLAALQKLPADRFASAAEFARALSADSVGESRRGASRAMPAAPRSRRGDRLARVAPWVVAALAVCAALWAWRKAAVPGPVTQLYLLSRSYERLAGQTDISPDGRAIVTATEYGLEYRGFDELETRAIPGAANPWSPRFAPSGREIAFATGFPGALKVAAVAGGGARVLVADSVMGNGIAWSDDGWLYFVHGAGLALARVRETGGTVEIVRRADAEADERGFLWPDVLPGGRTAIVTIWRNRESPEVAALDLEDGTLTPLLPGVRGVYASAGYLLSLQGGGVLQVSRFDGRRRALDGRPATVASGVWTEESGRSSISVSANGTLVYAGRGGEGSDLVRLDRRGRETIIAPDWRGDFSHVSVSPDGGRLAVGALAADGRQEIWVRDIEARSQVRVAYGGAYNYRVRWNPRGDSVSYTSDAAGGMTVLQAPADGSGPPVRLVPERFVTDEATWSADGRWVVFRTGSGSARDIYALDRATDSVHAILTTELEETTPELSPDGRWLAYVSEESNGSDVYVRAFPEGGRRWKISAGGTEPRWARSGRELVYRNARQELVVVPVEPGAEFRIGTPRVLFSVTDYASDNRHGAYSVGPDDESFYFIRSGTDQQEADIVVIQNWYAGLREGLER